MFDVVKKVFRNYANFNGRATNREYWLFVLFQLIVSTILFIPIIGSFVTMLTSFLSGDFGGSLAVGIISVAILSLYSLASTIPSLAVTCRRLHDSGRSGLYFFMVFIPAVGPFILIYFLVQPSTLGSNEFGEQPEE